MSTAITQPTAITQSKKAIQEANPKKNREKHCLHHSLQKQQRDACNFSFLRGDAFKKNLFYSFFSTDFFFVCDDSFV